MKFAIIALLGVASPLVQALAVEARAPEKPVPTFVFHNEKGEVVGERPYTAEELEWLKEAPPAAAEISGSNSTRTPHEKRAPNDDLFFRSHTYSVCATGGGDTFCTPPYFDLEVTRRPDPLCAGITVKQYAWNSNPCHRTFNVAGTVYLVDNCDVSLDWSVERPVARQLAVLKANGVRRGICLAIQHTNELGRACIASTVGNTWMRIAVCSNDF